MSTSTMNVLETLPVNTKREEVAGDGVPGKIDPFGKVHKDVWGACEVRMTGPSLTVVKVLSDLGSGIFSSLTTGKLTAYGEMMYLEIRRMISGQEWKCDNVTVRLKVKSDSVPTAVAAAATQPEKSKKQAKPGSQASKKDATPVLNSIEKARMENVKKTLPEKVASVLKHFVAFELEYNLALKSENLETKGIGLLFIASVLLSRIAYFSAENNKSRVYGVIVALQKFITRCTLATAENGKRTLISGRNVMSNAEQVQMSHTLIDDLTYCLEQLTRTFPFDGFTIYDHAPQLLTTTPYDDAIPNAEIKVREHQRELITKIEQNLDTGFFLVYNPMLGSGKTSCIIALGKLVERMRKTDPQRYGDLTVIFACNVETVRNQAMNLCYNSDLKFAVAVPIINNQESGEFKINRHNTVLDDKDISVIIASTVVARKILISTHGNTSKYITYLDEPTQGADNISSDYLHNNMNLISVASNKLVAVSATLPELEDIKPIVDDFHKRHSVYASSTSGRGNNVVQTTEEALLRRRQAFDARLASSSNGVSVLASAQTLLSKPKTLSVYSADIQIGCDLTTFDGVMKVPHSGITNAVALKKVIDRIRDVPYWGRMYTANIVRVLFREMHFAQVPDLPDVLNMFNNVDNMSASNVRDISMNLLNILATCDDKTIERVCRSDALVFENIISPATGFIPAQVSATRPAIQFVGSSPITQDNPADPLNFFKIATVQGYRLQGPTVIATLDPVAFTRRHFGSYVDIIGNFSVARDERTASRRWESFDHAKTVWYSEWDAHQATTKQLEVQLESKGGNGKKSGANDEEGGKQSRSSGDQPLTADQRAQIIEAHTSKPPAFLFPYSAQINTKEHLNYFASGHMDKIATNFIRDSISMSSIPVTTSKVSSDLMTLLCAGIGICVKHHSEIDVHYTNAVLALAAAGKLAYIIADESFTYGTNYPINRVIITDDYGDAHDVYDMIQALGRAGRVNQSWIAHGVMSEKIAKKLIDFVQEGTGSEVQATNMVTKYRAIANSKRSTDRLMLESLLQKYNPTYKSSVAEVAPTTVTTGKTIKIVRNSGKNALTLHNVLEAVSNEANLPPPAPRSLGIEPSVKSSAKSAESVRAPPMRPELQCDSEDEDVHNPASARFQSSVSVAAPKLVEVEPKAKESEPAKPAGPKRNAFANLDPRASTSKQGQFNGGKSNDGAKSNNGLWRRTE